MSNPVNILKTSSTYSELKKAFISDDMMYKLLKLDMHKPVVNGKVRADSGRSQVFFLGDIRVVIPEHILEDIHHFFKEGTPSKYIAEVDEHLILSHKCSMFHKDMLKAS